MLLVLAAVAAAHEETGMEKPIELSKLMIWRMPDGDICAGSHVRRFEVEDRAACEAVRLHLIGEEPKRPKYTWPRAEPQPRHADQEEVVAYYRLRVYENWIAMREVFAQKPRRKAARKEVRP